MVRTTRELQIFISSPGDVCPERDVVRQVTERLSRDPLVSEHCRIQTVAWDTPDASVPLDANVTPQQSVNEYLLLPSQCDLTVVLLWGRIGTPLPTTMARADGSQFQSGTIWELEDAYTHRKPVWIYRNVPAPAVRIDDAAIPQMLEQFKALDEYLKKARNPDQSIAFGIYEFGTLEQLSVLFESNLRHLIARTVRGLPPSSHPEEARIVYEAVVSAARAASFSDANSKPDTHSGERTSPAASQVYDLARYPIGPMVRDIEVRHLADFMAHMNEQENPAEVLGAINNALAAAAREDDPCLRLSVVEFPNVLGAKRFWSDVLRHAALNGPRMLAAVLQSIDRRRLDSNAAREFDTLIRKVNAYA